MHLPDLLLGLAFAFGCGSIFGWFLGRIRSPRDGAEDARLELELRNRIEDQQSDLAQLREQLAATQSARSMAEAKLAASDSRLEEQQRWHEQYLRDARESQEKALSDLRESFKSLSAESLKQSQPEFLRLANETLAKFQESAKGDLLQRQQSIETLVKPLQEHLKIYQERLAQTETRQSSAWGELKQHLDALAQQSHCLSSETLQLRRLLSSNQARGRWGEETLRRVIETAGMSVHCDFCEQPQSGDSKPDLLVRLPGDRLIVIDAKVPDFEFLQALEMRSGADRTGALQTHAAKLKNTIKSLADREYPRAFPNSLDHVILFLPAESLFSAALEGDPKLLTWAAAKRILLATPASLIGLLRTISLCWQQHAQSENARAISDAAEELFLRVCKFTEHLERLRTGMERANQAFNELVGSYERSVRPSGERLIQLGATQGNKQLARVSRIETTLSLPPKTPENA
jgi:DNA recombination protein RmuC